MAWGVSAGRKRQGAAPDAEKIAGMIRCERRNDKIQRKEL